MAATTQNPQNIEGFLTALTAADLGTGEADAAAYGGLHSQGVDGIHAGTEREVTSVIGDETYQHAAKLYVTGSGEAGSELLSRRSGGCMASTYIPAIASKKQTAILHSAGPNGGGVMRGDSVAAMWPTLEVVRDQYTKLRKVSCSPGSRCGIARWHSGRPRTKRWPFRFDRNGFLRAKVISSHLLPRRNGNRLVFYGGCTSRLPLSFYENRTTL